MNATDFLLPLLLTVGLCTAGCQAPQGDADEGSVSMSTAALCSGCGELKDSEECCDPDAATCSSCDLVKGSPGCCKLEQGAGDVAYCTACESLAADCQCQ